MYTTANSVLSNASAQPTHLTVKIDRKIVPRIREALEGIDFGKVTISIKDGEIVQIDRVQSTRVLRKNRN